MATRAVSELLATLRKRPPFPTASATSTSSATGLSPVVLRLDALMKEVGAKEEKITPSEAAQLLIELRQFSSAQYLPQEFTMDSSGTTSSDAPCTPATLLQNRLVLDAASLIGDPQRCQQDSSLAPVVAAEACCKAQKVVPASHSAHHEKLFTAVDEYVSRCTAEELLPLLQERDAYIARRSIVHRLSGAVWTVPAMVELQKARAHRGQNGRWLDDAILEVLRRWKVRRPFQLSAGLKAASQWIGMQRVAVSRTPSSYVDEDAKRLEDTTLRMFCDGVMSEVVNELHSTTPVVSLASPPKVDLVREKLLRQYCFHIASLAEHCTYGTHTQFIAKVVATCRETVTPATMSLMVGNHLFGIDSVLAAVPCLATQSQSSGGGGSGHLVAARLSSSPLAPLLVSPLLLEKASNPYNGRQQATGTAAGSDIDVLKNLGRQLGACERVWLSSSNRSSTASTGAGSTAAHQLLQLARAAATAAGSDSSSSSSHSYLSILCRVGYLLLSASSPVRSELLKDESLPMLVASLEAHTAPALHHDALDPGYRKALLRGMIVHAALRACSSTEQQGSASSVDSSSETDACFLQDLDLSQLVTYFNRWRAKPPPQAGGRHGSTADEDHSYHERHRNELSNEASGGDEAWFCGGFFIQLEIMLKEKPNRHFALTACALSEKLFCIENLNSKATGCVTDESSHENETTQPPPPPVPIDVLCSFMRRVGLVLGEEVPYSTLTLLAGHIDAEGLPSTQAALNALDAFAGTKQWSPTLMNPLLRWTTANCSVSDPSGQNLICKLFSAGCSIPGSHREQAEFGELVEATIEEMILMMEAHPEPTHGSNLGGSSHHHPDATAVATSPNAEIVYSQTFIELLGGVLEASTLRHRPALNVISNSLCLLPTAVLNSFFQKALRQGVRVESVTQAVAGGLMRGCSEPHDVSGGGHHHHRRHHHDREGELKVLHDLSTILVRLDYSWDGYAAAMERWMDGLPGGVHDAVGLCLRDPVHTASLIRKCDDDGTPLPPEFVVQFAEAVLHAEVGQTYDTHHHQKRGDEEDRRTTRQHSPNMLIWSPKKSVAAKVFNHLSHCRVLHQSDATVGCLRALLDRCLTTSHLSEELKRKAGSGGVGAGYHQQQYHRPRESGRGGGGGRGRGGGRGAAGSHIGGGGFMEEVNSRVFLIHKHLESLMHFGTGTSGAEQTRSRRGSTIAPPIGWSGGVSGGAVVRCDTDLVAAELTALLPVLIDGTDLDVGFDPLCAALWCASCSPGLLEKIPSKLITRAAESLAHRIQFGSAQETCGNTRSMRRVFQVTETLGPERGTALWELMHPTHWMEEEEGAVIL